MSAYDFTCWAISAAHQTKTLSRFLQEAQVYFLICMCLYDGQNMYPGLTQTQVTLLPQPSKCWNYRCTPPCLAEPHITLRHHFLFLYSYGDNTIWVIGSEGNCNTHKICTLCHKKDNLPKIHLREWRDGSWLRAVAAHAEDPGSDPIPHDSSQPYELQFQEIQCLGLCRHCVYMVHRHTYTQENIHTHKININ